MNTANFSNTLCNITLRYSTVCVLSCVSLSLHHPFIHLIVSQAATQQLAQFALVIKLFVLQTLSFCI